MEAPRARLLPLVASGLAKFSACSKLPGSPRDARNRLESDLFQTRFEPVVLLCYRRESGIARRNSDKVQEHGRIGWRARSSKKHLNVPGPLEVLDFPAPFLTLLQLGPIKLFRP